MPTDVLSCLVFVALWSPRPCVLSDRERFPPQTIAVQNLKITRECRDLVNASYPLWAHRYFDYQERKNDMQWRYECWDWLNAAQGGEGRGSDYWLYSLNRLRELLGDEAYFAGRLPPPVPLTP